jgi:prephenate dehydratase
VSIAKSFNIAVLGPPGTFSQKAADMFVSGSVSSSQFQLKFYRSLRLTCEAVLSECEFGVVPIENSLAGFVPEVLDVLCEENLSILGQVKLGIKFSFVTNASILEDVKYIYAQPMAVMQCSRFIETLGGEVVFVESNIVALQRIVEGDASVGSIVPTEQVLSMDKFVIRLDDVLDADDSITRFVMLGNSKFQYALSNISVIKEASNRSSIVVIPKVDTPGSLERILRPFSQNGIDIAAIISRRSSKKGLYFFLDIIGETDVRDVVSALSKLADVRYYGSYPCIGAIL